MHANPVPRRRHSAELKMNVLAACNEPGASIAAVALSHGLNANLVRKWLVGRGLKRPGISAPAAAGCRDHAAHRCPLLAADAHFLPIELAAPAPDTHAESVRQGDATPATPEPIHVELCRGALHLSVRWPSSAAGDCRAWLRELSSGLLK